MNSLFIRADDVLRCRRWTTDRDKPLSTIMTLVLIVVAFGMLYGGVMGSFGCTSVERLKQVLYSAVKVPLLLFLTFAISLPSFYVINMLLGLGQDFRLAVRALVATQAGIAIVLASFAPYTLLWYATSSRYDSAIFVNAVMFGCASFAGQWLMRKNYRILIERNPLHRYLLWAWILVYALVGIQMGWILRPFIGTLNSETVFIRVEEWTNAYVVVFQLVTRILNGR